MRSARPSVPGTGSICMAWTEGAIDAGIGDVSFPKGIYRITKPIVIDLDRVGPTSIHGRGVATLRMEGPGPAIRFVGTHFKSADPGGFEPNVWQRQRMPLVDGLAITATHEQADAIEAIGTMQLTITPAGPSSSASWRVCDSSAALAAETAP